VPEDCAVFGFQSGTDEDNNIDLGYFVLRLIDRTAEETGIVISDPNPFEIGSFFNSNGESITPFTPAFPEPEITVTELLHPNTEYVDEGNDDLDSGISTGDIAYVHTSCSKPIMCGAEYDSSGLVEDNETGTFRILTIESTNEDKVQDCSIDDGGGDDGLDGKVIYEFEAPVTLNSLDFFNTTGDEAGKPIQLFDSEGIEIMPGQFTVPDTGAGMWAPVSFGVPDVSTVVVGVGAEGAMDNLSYSIAKVEATYSGISTVGNDLQFMNIVPDVADPDAADINGVDVEECSYDGKVRIIDEVYSVYSIENFVIDNCEGANGTYTGVGVKVGASSDTDDENMGDELAGLFDLHWDGGFIISVGNPEAAILILLANPDE
jgi:hypothetical protein